MSSPRTVPSRGDKDVMTFTVRVDGADVPKTLEIAGISCFKGIAKIPFARVELLDGDPAGQTFPISEGDSFAPGKELEILAGYRSQEDIIFKGIIVGQKIRIRQDGRGLLTVLCRHPLYQSTLTLRNRTWKDASDADAISGSFGEYDISTSAESGGVNHSSLIQYQSTDWDFAVVRARANGLFLIPTDGGADLLKPDFAQEAALSLQFGATVLELDAEFDIRDQPVAAHGTAWSSADQETVELDGAEPEPPAAGSVSPGDMAAIHGQSLAIRHPGAVGEEELQAFADGALLLRRLGAITGRVRCTGTPAPLPGAVLKFEGAGARFSGDFLISAVRHTLAAGVWTTDIQFGIPREPLPVEQPAAEMSPAVRGLQIGLVVGIEDPEGEFRVEILLPALGEVAETIWARLATFDAGDNRGAVFFPEVGDEVVVGFLADDPRHPIILGSLYSSARPSPVSPEDANPSKGYFSREGVTLVFDDDKKSLAATTPGGRSFTLDDDSGEIRAEDADHNKAVANSDGISLESAKNLTLQAKADASLEGANVSAKADAIFKASGSSGAELSASGNTVIKGALVQIN